MKTILITGINGFVGTNFTCSWSKNHTLIGLDIHQPEKEWGVPHLIGPYGESKIKAEEYLLDKQHEAERLGKRVYILRPCMIHEPGNKGNLNLLYSIVKKGIPWSLGAINVQFYDDNVTLTRQLTVSPQGRRSRPSHSRRAMAHPRSVGERHRDLRSERRPLHSPGTGGYRNQ